MSSTFRLRVGLVLLATTVLAGPVLAQDAGGAPAAAPAASSSAPAGAPDGASTPSAAQSNPFAPSNAVVPADAASAAATTPAEPATQTAAAAAPAAPAVPTSCLVAPAKLSQNEVDAFLANPGSLLNDGGMPTVELSNRVRSLAGSDSRTLSPLLDLSRNAAADQQSGIGAGLGRAAFACTRTNPDYAAEIQSRIAELNQPGVITAFLAASNDIQVAAIGTAGSPGGGVASAPGLSGGGAAGPNSGGLGGDAVTPNGVTGLSSSGRSGIVVDDGSDGSSVNVFFINGPSSSPTTP